MFSSLLGIFPLFISRLRCIVAVFNSGFYVGVLLQALWLEHLPDYTIY
jgi:hypothetical protein